LPHKPDLNSRKKSPKKLITVESRELAKNRGSLDTMAQRMMQRYRSGSSPNKIMVSDITGQRQSQMVIDRSILNSHLPKRYSIQDTAGSKTVFKILPSINAEVKYP
jgi:hypothetical protein